MCALGAVGKGVFDVICVGKVARTRVTEVKLTNVGKVARTRVTEVKLTNVGCLRWPKFKKTSQSDREYQVGKYTEMTGIPT